MKTADSTGTSAGGLQVETWVQDRDVRIEVEIPHGQVVAVLGPNGAGKSTLLSVISGLLRPDHGRVVLDGRPLVDTVDGIWIPPHRRAIVQLAQEALLFPHLTVAANVAFGPRSRGVGRLESRQRADHWLQAVGALEFSARRPGKLSGGQAQRVAIARALAAEPEVLLLDEPTAALDVGVAPGLRQLLRAVLRDTGRTALLVTHDLVDALTLADRVIVIEQGRIVEDGPTRSVLSRPRSAFAARIAGINLISGTATATGLVTGSGRTVSARSAPDVTPGTAVVAVFHPSAVAVHVGTPEGSPRNHFPITIAGLQPWGDIVRVRSAPVDGEVESDGLLADITAAAAADLQLVPGMVVHFAVKATETTIHPAAGRHPETGVS